MATLHTPSPFTGEQASKAMLEGLMSHIRAALRERIMESIKADIDAAVDAGAASFKATVESYRDSMNMRDVVRVLIERKQEDPSSHSGADRGGVK